MAKAIEVSSVENYFDDWSKKLKIGIVAHDAGAARHVFSWIQHLKCNLSFYTKGPAYAIMREGDQKNINELSLEQCIEGCNILISGTSWQSDIEHKARKLAKKKGIPSIAVVDHWVNYSSRFEFQGVKVLPDTIWVADAEAASIALEEFPNTNIIQLPNIWIDNIMNEVCQLRKSLQHNKVLRPGKNALYLLEPIKISKSKDELINVEFNVLDYWLQKLELLMKHDFICIEKDLIKLTLRPHPSEPQHKYDEWIVKNSSTWRIQLDTNKNLAESLADADIVFGGETQALIAALACGIPAISTLPPSLPNCRLPHKSIVHLRDLV